MPYRLALARAMLLCHMHNVVLLLERALCGPGQLERRRDPIRVPLAVALPSFQTHSATGSRGAWSSARFYC
jgi:hypothetical protein